MMSTFIPSTLAFLIPEGGQWIVILILGLLIFGRRLPEVGRSMGQGIREFKKGLKDVENDVENGARDEPAQRKSLPGEQVMQSPEGTKERSQQH
jgi:sec-independent protein translocase protein TatA